MNSKTPTIRQIYWISVIPHLIIMGLLILFFYQHNPETAFMFGSGTYLIMSFGLRYFVPRSHRIGMKMVNQQKFLDAITYFESSYDFFGRNNWIDKFRFVTLLSSSKTSYKEMALNNIAFCYAQAGNGLKSREYYEKTLSEFPNSGMAKAGLNLLIAGEESKNGL